MAKIELEASPRTVLGKKVKALRRQGIAPVNIFGHGVPSAALQVETRALARALASAGKSTLLTLNVPGEKPRTVVVKAIQLEPKTHSVLHVDFYQVNLKEKMNVDVPLHFTGEVNASMKAGALVHALTALQVECLPGNMPHAFEVDISSLKSFDESIHVKDLTVPKGVTVLNDPEQVVARVEPPRVSEEPVEAAPTEETPAE